MNDDRVRRLLDRRRRATLGHDREDLSRVHLSPRQEVTVIARTDADGSERRFRAIARLDGPIEVEYLRQGGILPAVLRRLARD